LALRATLALISDKRDVKRAFEKSLGTPDRREAEALAAPLIAQHKKLLVVHAARVGQPSSFRREVLRLEIEPGKYNHSDGSMTVATQREITVFHADGSMSTRLNLKVRDDFQLDAAALPPPLRRAWSEAGGKERATKLDVDAEIIEEFIRERNKNADDAKLARDTLVAFKAVNGGKTISASGKMDVQALVTHLLAKGGKNGTGVKHGTVRRALAQLKAAVNLELKADHPRLTRNVFATVAIDGDEGATRRDPYTDADVQTVRANLDKLDPEERLMWLWHVSSGIRPGGIYSIASDEWESAEDPDQPGIIHRTRHVRIMKDKSRKFGPRNLPVPQAVLDSGLLPEKISEPLFKRRLKPLLVALNGKLAAAPFNVNAGTKTFYSARHRAADRMRDRVPEKIRKAILGHSRSDMEDRYGHGHAMWRIKLEMDKIGA
jgi:hypothetical protein